MLVVPVAEKFTWKNPPYITLVLIIINIVVLFKFQGDDEHAMNIAVIHYFESGLAAIELPLYEAYRQSSDKPLEIPDEVNHSSNLRDEYIFREMEHDLVFQDMLMEEQLVTPESPDYVLWKESRDEFMALKENVFTNRYSFVPEEHRPLTFFTYMFLHGGFGHLLGNMIFLWLFGCILEIGCGRSLYLLVYGLTGILAACLYWALNVGSVIGLVGASGAISGLMGAYTVLFGKTRIKLFMYLGFYFNYVRIPAIVLLPFWLLREMYGLMGGPENNVAYAAHLGGIVSGALAGWMILKYSDFNNHDVFKEAKGGDGDQLMEKALAHMGKLEFESGKALLWQAIEENRRNYTAYEHIYNLEKQNPGTEAFQDIAQKYLWALCSDKNQHDRVHTLYKEYRTLAKPKLSAELFMELSLIFAKRGHVPAAVTIVEMILKKKPGLPGIPTVLLELSTAFKQMNQSDKFTKYSTILTSKYPDTREAALVMKIMETQR